jgi:hypothetical protein
MAAGVLLFRTGRNRIIVTAGLQEGFKPRGSLKIAQFGVLE